MNYSKINGLFVCKMAMLLAFMFAACSESDGPVAGGTVEETGVYALAGQVGDKYPKLIAPNGSKADSSMYSGSVFVDKGSIVIVRELDLLTLDTTGRIFVDTVDNDSGHFAFENLSLNSPYVLIENKVPYDTTLYTPRTELSEDFYDPIVRVTKYKEYSAVVNLRDVKNVNVSTLTTMKVPLLQKYFAEGNSYAQASKMAEREILENFEIYEDLGTFEEMPEDDSELYYVNKLSQLSARDMRDYVETMGIMLAFASPKSFSMKGAVMERYYLNSMKMIGYEIGYLAHLDSIGRCTESRENETAEVKGLSSRYSISVVCRSGKWTIGFKTVEHTMGTMTDNRDGKTYKTVTYNFGGTPQIWMAENLDFTDTTSLSVDSSLRANLSGAVYCYHEPYVEKKDNECGVYGHEYLWRAAMNISDDEIKTYSVGAQGDSILVSKNCLDAYVNAYVFEPGLNPEWNFAMSVADSCDALLNAENVSEDTPARTWTWNYADFITPSNQNSYQGICPDGWRIPTLDDWMTLLQNLGEQYGVEYGSAVIPLYDDVATGFGLNSVAKFLGVDVGHVMVEGFSFYNYFIMADASYYVAEFFTRWDTRSGLNFNFPDVWHALLYWYNNPDQHMEWLQSNRVAPYESGAVRCIKK